MADLSHQEINNLLQKKQQVNTIETYQHFPEVITASPFGLEARALSYLLDEGLIEQQQENANGKVYGFTRKSKIYR